MLSLADIQEAILGEYKGTREITFMPAPRAGLEQFLTALLRNYDVESAQDNDGSDVSHPLRDRDFTLLFDAPENFVYADLVSETSLISRLKVFVDWCPESPGYAVELSFQRNDLLLPFELGRFLELVEQYNCELKPEDYFVRYENASWALYDADGWGVIYTGSQWKRARRSTPADS